MNKHKNHLNGLEMIKEVGICSFNITKSEVPGLMHAPTKFDTIYSSYQNIIPCKSFRLQALLTGVALLVLDFLRSASAAPDVAA